MIKILTENDIDQSYNPQSEKAQSGRAIAKALENIEVSGGGTGENGATFTPSVSSAGVISWTNDKGLPNPTSVNIKGQQGEKGEQGFSVLRVTTALSSYTTAVGGFSPKYRIALSTVKTESGASEVRVGDTILRNYYTYLVGYVDSSYVYVGAYASIRGTAGEKGADGYTPQKGVDYFDGKDGINGADGYTPIKGVDYYTEEDKAEYSQYIANELAKRGQLKPEYANSVDECTDKTKMYVLPDGFIYAYMITEKEIEGGASYTNKLPSATDTDKKTIYGGDYNGDGVNDGYKTRTRISGSSGADAEAADVLMCASGFISAKVGDVVRIKGTSPVSSIQGYIITYKGTTRVANKNIASTNGVNWASQDYYDYVDETLVIPLTSANFGADFDCFRFSCHMDGNTIVTVNRRTSPGRNPQGLHHSPAGSVTHRFLGRLSSSQSCNITVEPQLHYFTIPPYHRPVSSQGRQSYVHYTIHNTYCAFSKYGIPCRSGKIFTTSVYCGTFLIHGGQYSKKTILIGIN